MCSRYTLSAPPDAVRAFFAYREHPNFPARYNIAPTQPVPVVIRGSEGVPQFVLMRWGFIPAYVKGDERPPVLINARSETVAEKAAFRAAFKRRRCLLPADGFYEWTGPKGAKRPFLFSRPEAGLFGFAGIWECWQDGKNGGEIDTVAILTCGANKVVGQLHDRMPVILRPEQFETWLGGEETELEAASQLLKPAPDDFLQAEEMDPRINNSKIDEPGIQQPVQPALL